MGNFCSNCGSRMKGEFCSSCGENNQKLKYWEATEIDQSDDYRKKLKGSLALNQREIVFYRDKFLSGESKIYRRIPLAGIKSITRTSIFNLTMIKYNQKPEKTGFWSKVFNKRTISYKIKDWQSFIESIQRLNLNIKIRC